MPTAQQLGLSKSPGPQKQKPKPQVEATSEHSLAPAAQPPRTPIPVLQNIGFWGGIDQFNNRVEQIVNAHQRELGVVPTPALTLDIARADVPDSVIPRLFDGHSAPQANGALNKEREQNPDSFFHVRSDGLLEVRNPILRMVQAHDMTQMIRDQVLGKNLPPPYPQGATRLGAELGKRAASVPIGRAQTLNALQAKYPNVQMGMLPIPGAQELSDALGYLEKHGGIQDVSSQGMNLDEYTKQVERAYPGAIPSDVVQRIRQGTYQNQAVYSINQAKVDLAKQMGTPLSDGTVFTQDDVKKLSNWMKSEDYFRKVTKFQAQQAGFGGNVAAYVKAWKSKQGAVRKHGLFAQFLNAMPLQLFGHGGFGWSLLSVPGYIVGGSKNPLNVGLHAITRSAGLALDTIGGTVEEGKSWLATGGAFVNAISPQEMMGQGKTFDQALTRASEQLRRNPTWGQVLFPGMHENEFTQALNIAGDFVLLRKATFTGERVAAGDLAGAKNSTYLKTAAGWSYNYLATGDKTKLGQAAAMLEGGQGANRLATAAYPLIKAGKLTREQYEQHVADLYATGTTEIQVGDKTVTITGRPLSSMQTGKLPTPGTLGRTWLASKQHLRSWLDDFDRSPKLGGQAAGTFVATLRSAINHAAPKGAMHYFDTRLPKGVYNFVHKWKLGDPTLANKMSSDIVRFQAKDNVTGIQKVERQLEGLYRAKYPITRSGIPAEAAPVAKLETEAPSLFHFPGGGDRELDGAFAKLQGTASKVGNALNAFAKFRTRLILSTGFSLGWKHLFGDGWRAIVGGVLTREAGAGRAAAEIDALARANPEVERRLGVFLNRAKMGETRYALGREGAVKVPAFSTGEKFGKPSYMEAAGGELRRFALSDALTAYEQGALAEFVRSNTVARRLYFAARKDVTGPLTIEEYADEMAARFRQIEDGARAAGVPDVWSQAQRIIAENRGTKADAALGKFIQDQKIDFNVHSPRVEVAGSFDQVTGKAIGFLMSPNKMWRTKLATNTLHNTYAQLTAAGFEQRTALETAMELSGKIVNYHMLDFSNRLQIEQDLRWLSWFATKHRLYWKWVIGTFLRQPGWAAVVDDARKELDNRGYLNFTLAGHKLSIPAARLFWVPGKEYDETSPDAQVILDMLRHGSINPWPSLQRITTGSGTGNVITRIDVPLRLAVKAATAHTYGDAVAGLSEKERSLVNRDINEYQLAYFHDHGHYATETQAVKHVLWHRAAEEAWRSTLPFPVVPDTSRTAQQALIHEYMLLVSPEKKRAFLDQHPDVAKHFGVYDDPKAFVHNRGLSDRYTQLLDNYRAARRSLFDSAKRDGFTPALRQTKTKLDAAFQKDFAKLLREDARWAGHHVQDNQTPGESNVPYGPWGKLVSADPQLDVRHELNALFPKLAQPEYNKVYGTLQKQLQAELKLLNDPAFAATYVDQSELKTRKGEILQQLEAFRKAPTDALGKTYLAYQQKYVNPYWQHVDSEYRRIAALPTADRQQAYAEFADWRDKQDKSVKVDGVEFPSPIRMAWANMDPTTRAQRLRYFASKNWSDLTDYERELITGVKPKVSMSEAWRYFKQYYDDAAKKLELEGGRVPKGYKLTLAKYIDKYSPGFYKDFLFAGRPLFYRLQLTEQVQRSRFKSQWHQLLTLAGDYYKYISAGYSKNATKATWREYVKSPAFVVWLDSEPGFKKELADYGPNLLNGLLTGNE